MTARRREDLYARRNETFAGVFEFSHPDGEPVDFTDATAALEVRLHGAAPGDALLRLEPVSDLALGGLVLSPGAIAYRSHEVTMARLPAGRGAATTDLVFDLIVTLPGQDPANWRWGYLRLAPGVTDRTVYLTAGGAELTAGGAPLIAG